MIRVSDLWRVILGALVLVAFVVTWFVFTGDGTPVSGVQRQAPAEPWKLPYGGRAKASAADADAVLRSRVWGGDPPAQGLAAAAAEAAKDNRWWLIGIYGSGNSRAVMVGRTNDRPLTLKQGDTLPSGHVIAGVQSEGVCVMIDGKRRLLPLNVTTPKVW